MNKINILLYQCQKEELELRLYDPEIPARTKADIMKLALESYLESTKDAVLDARSHDKVKTQLEDSLGRNATREEYITAILKDQKKRFGVGEE
ncbi:hypothetical protein JW930_00260 [Candidatus Woesearchaeota archaeon]|nr:hypothetical protein [Candidatus Woesearchaeota archaeon]